MGTSGNAVALALRWVVALIFGGGLAASCDQPRPGPPGPLQPPTERDLTPALRSSPLETAATALQGVHLPSAVLASPAVRRIELELPHGDPVLTLSYGLAASVDPGCPTSTQFDIDLIGGAGLDQPVPLLSDSIGAGAPGWRSLERSLASWEGQQVELEFRVAARSQAQTPCPAPPAAFGEVLLTSGVSAPLAGDLQPDIAVIVVDALRADHLGYAGAQGLATPAIDALALESLAFTQAFSVSSWTRESIFSFATASYFSMGVLGNRDIERFAMPRGVPPLARRLADHGYHTEAIVDNPALGLDSGFQAGFRRYVVEASDDAFPARLEGVLAGRDQRLPLFLYLHLMAPHMPFEFHAETTPAQLEAAGFSAPWPQLPDVPRDIREHPPSDEIKRAMRASYRAEVEWVDGIVGELVEILDRHGTDRPLWLVFMADHGEELWDHGSFEHGNSLYQELLHVPLLVRPPRDGAAGVAGTREDGVVTLVDLGLTLQELAGIEPGQQPVGLSLLPRLEGRPLALPPERTTLALGLVHGHQRQALRRGAIKHTRVASDPAQSFIVDLAADPAEQRPLPVGDPQGALRRFRAEWGLFRRLALSGSVVLSARFAEDRGQPVGLGICHDGSIALAEVLPAGVPVELREGPVLDGRRCDSFSVPGGEGVELRIELGGVAEGMPAPAAWLFDGQGPASPALVRWPSGATEVDRQVRLALPWAVFEPWPRPLTIPAGLRAVVDWHFPLQVPADALYEADEQREKLRVLGYVP
jgi:arylsulfatase A-like enzyme